MTGELPDSYEQIMEQLEDEIEKDNGDRREWLLHLALRRMDERTGELREQVDEVDDRTQDIHEAVQDIKSSNLVSNSRWLKIMSITVTLSSLLIASASML